MIPVPRNPSRLVVVDSALKNFRLICSVVVVALSFYQRVSLAADSARQRPNVVVILADDYGWGSVGCYGAKGVSTPSLDRLAKEGRRFLQAYAPGSVCSPTRYGLMTGRYYWRTTVKDGKVLAYNAPLHIETNRLTLPSLFKSRGYATGGFGKWHLGWTSERVTDWSQQIKPGPLEVGFDYYYGMAANIGSGPHSFIENHEVTGRVPGQPIRVNGGSRAGDTTTGIEKGWEPDRIMEKLTERVTGWIETNRANPFFVYFAPNAVHEPIVPNGRFTNSVYGAYGDFISELDWSVGRILDTLDRFKLTENTLALFTSDNGGVVNPGNPSASAAIKAGLAINGPLRGGKHTEWEGGFREPFLVRWPGKVPAGTVSDQVISLTDLVATFASLLEVPLPSGNAEDSFDILHTFTEPSPGQSNRGPVVLQAANAVYAIRVGDWKYIERENAPPFESARNPRKAEAVTKGAKTTAMAGDELFNLKEDPFETRNVLPSNPDRAAELKRALTMARDRGFTRVEAGQ